MMPYFNKLVSCIDKKMAYKFVLLFFLFTAFSTWAKPLGGDVFRFSEGYSFLWIAVLYVFGAIIKKYEIQKKFVRKRGLIFLSVVCILITWGWKVYGKVIPSILVTYVSPTIVIVAISLFLLFTDMHIGVRLKRFIRFFAPVTFGVYLIHTQPLFFERVLKDKFIWIASLHPIAVPLAVIASATGIFVVCALIDKVREMMFVVLKVRHKVDQLENLIRRVWEKVQKTVRSLFLTNSI